jgi:hypothetical protein
MANDTGEKVLAGFIVGFFILAILAIAIGVRYWMSGGDWSCAIAADPALCHAVKEMRR